MMFKPWSVVAICALSATVMGCGGDDDDDSAPSKTLGAPNPDGQPGDAQTPPTTSGAAIEAWLKDGTYESWACEEVAHPQMGVSPHGKNRVCANDLAVAFAADSGTERPRGTAAVKELYDDDSKLVGYAVSVKVEDASQGGDAWYWYERVPLDSPAPHDGRGVVAEGLGSDGAAQQICVGCHAAAGADKTHRLTGSADFIYLQPGVTRVNPDGDAQTPPTGDATALEAWLEEGVYESWACETVPHPRRGVSAHGVNRVCSNDLAASFTGSPGDERPPGTASVKELYDDASNLVGYAVAVKLDAASAAGKGWYWYERAADRVNADGRGDASQAKSACVGCHSAAGTDGTHSVTGSSDYVYLQVNR